MAVTMPALRSAGKRRRQGRDPDRHADHVRQDDGLAGELRADRPEPGGEAGGERSAHERRPHRGCDEDEEQRGCRHEEQPRARDEAQQAARDDEPDKDPG